MELREYLDKKRGLRKILAKCLNLPQQNITNWLCGTKKIPIKHALMIEKVTKHVVKIEDMRPEYDWSVLREPQ